MPVVNTVVVNPLIIPCVISKFLHLIGTEQTWYEESASSGSLVKHVDQSVKLLGTFGSMFLMDENILFSHWFFFSAIFEVYLLTHLLHEFLHEDEFGKKKNILNEAIWRLWWWLSARSHLTDALFKLNLQQNPREEAMNWAFMWIVQFLQQCRAESLILRRWRAS